MSRGSWLGSRHLWANIGLLGALYLSQGLPYGFFTQALPVLMREQGYSLEQIGLSSLLVLPWALKFLWAPLVDRYGSERVGLRRSWIIPLQLASATLLIAIGFYEPGTSLLPLLVAVFLVNLLSATQDIATDGLAVDRLAQDERGLANGIQVAGYRLGMIIGGGLLLIIYGELGRTWTFVSMGLLILVASAPVLFARETARIQSGSSGGTPSLLFSGDHFIRRTGALRVLVLIFAYKLGEAFAVAMIRPYLSDAGLTLSDIGWLLGTVGFASGLAGAVVGGSLVNVLGRRRALLCFGVLQMLTVLGYAAVAASPVDRDLLYIVCGAEHFASGMATAALFTCMMDWCRPSSSATDYTVQASVVVIATAGAAAISGFSAQALDYPGHFLLAAAFALVAVLLVVAFFPRAAPGAADTGRRLSGSTIEAGRLDGG